MLLSHLDSSGSSPADRVAPQQVQSALMGVGNMNLEGLSGALHPGGCVNGVPEEAIAGHREAHHPSDAWTWAADRSNGKDNLTNLLFSLTNLGAFHTMFDKSPEKTEHLLFVIEKNNFMDVTGFSESSKHHFTTILKIFSSKTQFNSLFEIQLKHIMQCRHKIGHNFLLFSEEDGKYCLNLVFPVLCT